AIPVHAYLGIAPGLLDDPVDDGAGALAFTLERNHLPGMPAGAHPRRESHHTGEAIGGRLDGVLVAARSDTVLEQRRQQAAARAAGANEQRHDLAVMVRGLDRHVFLDGVSPVLVERN